MARRESRRQRFARRTVESSRARLALVACIVIALGVIGGVLYWVTAPFSARPEVSRQNVSRSAPSDPSSSVASAIMASGTVEVPSIQGMHQRDAEVLIGAAGLSCSVRSSAATGDVVSEMVVDSQNPPAGALVKAGTQVVIVLSANRPALRSAAATVPVRDSWLVVIDPGHQSQGDTSPEAIGPGSKITKPCITGGSTGIVTQVPEYEVVLQIATNLKSQLERRGVRVVMTRTTSDVNISNVARAKMADKRRADLFIRIHCEASPDSAASGIGTLYPNSNRWTRPVASRSLKAASLIQQAAVRSTGAVNLGMKARSDLAGFNWSTVPCLLVQCGYLSNPVEDRLLSSPHYQDKLGSGLADGIVQYLEWSER